eukprot:gene10341-biopygen7755
MITNKLSETSMYLHFDLLPYALWTGALRAMPAASCATAPIIQYCVVLEWGMAGAAHSGTHVGKPETCT